MERLLKNLQKETEMVDAAAASAVMRKKQIKMSSMDINERRNAYKSIDQEMDIVISKYIEDFLREFSRLYPEFMERWSKQTGAQKWHDVGEGGLKNHSIRLAKIWIKNVIDTTVDTVPSLFLLVFVAITHDFCKVYHYYKINDNEYGVDAEQYKHHSKLSVDILEKEMGFVLEPAARTLILLHMSGFQNQEDMAALTKEDRDWLTDLRNIQILQLLNNADCK